MARDVHRLDLHQRGEVSGEPQLSATAFEIVRDLTPLNRVFSSPDYDRAVERLCEELPFSVHTYHAAEGEVLGWVIPPRWELRHATIARSDTGKLVYDGTQHPLAVIALSTSFRGIVSREELQEHLHYDHRFDDAIPFHFRQQYRPWERTWGFCVPKTVYDGLASGSYEVVIETSEGPGDLKVLEYVHPGKLPESFVFVAHLDHPGMANDDLAGCAAAVDIFRHLRGRRTKFTYRLLVVQEILGSVYWWERTNRGNVANVLEGVFLEMLGSKTELALQASASGSSNLESAIERSLVGLGLAHRTGPFKSIIVNDEYIWESYGVSMASLSRFPYPEYHTNRDDVRIISPDALHEAVDVFLRAIDELEEGTLVRRCFEGTPCLSNPIYDLYVDPGQVAFGSTADATTQRRRLLMDLVPTLHRPTTTRTLAERVGLPEPEVLAYLRQWEERGLVELA